MRLSSLKSIIKEEIKRLQLEKKTGGCGNLKSCKADADCPHDGYSCEDGCCVIACKKGESDKECKARKKKALKKQKK